MRECSLVEGADPLVRHQLLGGMDAARVSTWRRVVEPGARHLPSRRQHPYRRTAQSASLRPRWWCHPSVAHEAAPTFRLSRPSRLSHATARATRYGPGLSWGWHGPAYIDRVDTSDAHGRRGERTSDVSQRCGSVCPALDCDAFELSVGKELGARTEQASQRRDGHASEEAGRALLMRQLRQRRQRALVPMLEPRSAAKRLEARLEHLNGIDAAASQRTARETGGQALRWPRWSADICKPSHGGDAMHSLCDRLEQPDAHGVEAHLSSDPQAEPTLQPTHAVLLEVLHEAIDPSLVLARRLHDRGSIVRRLG